MLLREKEEHPVKRVSSVIVLLTMLLVSSAVAHAAPAFEQIAVFDVPEANQGIGVDDSYFYAVDNRAIGKYDKRTGELVAKWQGPADGPIIHLDSAAIIDGKLYCAHSNYSQYPMTSSVEIWDPVTMEHIGVIACGTMALRQVSCTVGEARPGQATG
jgi:hypothetical protein